MLPVVGIVVIACVVLLTRGGSPALATGIYVIARLVLGLFAGGNFLGVLVGVVISGLIAFAWFWLLDRLEGSGWWWLALVGGLLLLF